MAKKKNQPQQAPPPPPAATQGEPMVFGKMNYLIMVAGVLLMAAGYLAMTGGASHDPNVFPADEIYSFRRITLGPLLILLGLTVQIPAILYKSKD